MRLSSLLQKISFALAISVTALTANASSYPERDDVQQFIAQMNKKYSFNADELNSLFGNISTNQTVIARISKPAESKPWYFYRHLFLNNQRIQGGVAFWQKHRETLAAAEQQYGVPAALIVALIGMETDYGSKKGTFKVMEALSTLTFDYPKRSNYFRKELEEYLLLSREQGWQADEILGSYAGAMGYPQFMPSSYRAYAIDLQGNHRADIIGDPKAAISSVGNYLKGHGWQMHQPVIAKAYVVGQKYQQISKSYKPTLTLKELSQFGIHASTNSQYNTHDKASLIKLDAGKKSEYWLGFDNFYTIMRYNNSPLYAMAAYQLSQILQVRYDNTAAFH